MRKFLKFLHTLSAVGLTGGLAAYMLVLSSHSEAISPEGHAAMRASLELVSSWLLVPSLMLALFTGLMSMAIHHPFHNMGWVWAKALAGFAIFEGTLANIDAPAKKAAAATAQAAAGEVSPEVLAQLVRDDWAAWWVLLALYIANIALAIWRPRFARK